MTFEDLGLRSELAEAARAAGYDAPAPLQAAAVPVIRRGSNVLLRASAGAGVVGAYALGLLDRVLEDRATGSADADALRPAVLVLVADGEAANVVAASAGRFAHAAELRAAALDEGWAVGPAVDLLVAVPDAVLAAVQTSRLKLDGLRALVVDGASAILELMGETLETVSGIMPGDAQRIVVGDGDAVKDYAERHARRAMTFPPAPPEGADPDPAVDATIRYAAIPDGRKLDIAVRVLAGAGPATVICHSGATAEHAARELAVRGFTDPCVVARADDLDGFVLSWEAPFDTSELAERHGSGGAILVRPRELAHLRRIAAETGAGLAPLPPTDAPATALDAFRDRLRDAARTGDLEAQLLVVAPLLEELSMAEIAAAATLLARQRVPREAPAPGRAPSAGQPPAPEHRFTRLFISAGSRDNIGPGDIVGAITGEADVSGDRVGKIEIAESYTLVDVDRTVARKVIDALNGTTMRGRSLRVDFDRKGSRGPRRPAPRRRG